MRKPRLSSRVLNIARSIDIACRHQALWASSDGLNSQALSPSFAWGVGNQGGEAGEWLWVLCA